MNYSDLERITNSMFSAVFSGASSVQDAVTNADTELKQSFADLKQSDGLILKDPAMIFTEAGSLRAKLHWK